MSAISIDRHAELLKTTRDYLDGRISWEECRAIERQLIEGRRLAGDCSTALPPSPGGERVTPERAERGSL